MTYFLFGLTHELLLLVAIKVGSALPLPAASTFHEKRENLSIISGFTGSTLSLSQFMSFATLTFVKQLVSGRSNDKISVYNLKQTISFLNAAFKA